jgi:hypothetical protein
MKIDIGADGKILGTKKVSPNGQVSGLSEYAGQEVLVVLPGREAPEVKFDLKDYASELEAAATEHMRLAFKEYKHLKERFASPGDAAKNFVKTLSPKTFHGLIENADKWVKEQVSTVEKKFDKRLDRTNGKAAEVKTA